MDVCQHCGAAFTKQTAKFCGKCGTRKAPVAVTVSAAAATATTPAPTKAAGSSAAPPLTTSYSHTAPTLKTSGERPESNPNHTLRPSSSLHRGPAASSSKNGAEDGGGYATVDGGRLSLNGRVGLEASAETRRRSSLAHILAAAAAAADAAPAPTGVPSTVEFKDPLTNYTHDHASGVNAQPYRRGSTTIKSGGDGAHGDAGSPSPSSAPPTTAPRLPMSRSGTTKAASRRSSSATIKAPQNGGDARAAGDVEVFDMEGELSEELFMPLPPEAAASATTGGGVEGGQRGAVVGAAHDADSEDMLEPDPEQEAQYTAWATLGPDGITPEMLQTSNIAELKGWQKGTLIGRGTYGSVYLGLLRDGSFQAVKCVEIGARATSAGTFDAKELVSLSREINMMQRLRHKNLCKFRGVYYNPQETSICMFMEYIGGGSVSTLVKRFKPLPPQVVRSWTKQLLSGLLYLHTQNIIHRDVKGDNVLVDTSASPASEAQIKLVDFGAARRLTDAVSQSRTVIGTPYWMAPEVVDLSGDGSGYSYKADVWSVGCTVAEMLTGKPPWPTRTNAPAAIMMIACSEGMPTEIPKEEATPGCYAFMLACFERDPAKRPTVEDLLEHPWITGAME